MCHCQLTRALIVTLDWYSSFSQDERGRLAEQSHLIRPNTYESERIGLTCIRFIKHRFWACSRRYYVPDVAFHRQRTINVSLLDHARLLLPLHVTTHLQVPCRPLTGLNAATSSILLHSSALYPAVRLACSVRSPIHCSEYLSLILSSVFPVTVVPAYSIIPHSRGILDQLNQSTLWHLWMNANILAIWYARSCITLLLFAISFLQRVSLACYAERCISYDRFRPSVCPSQSGIMSKRLKLG